jgi:hypothetical protein
MSLPLLKFLLPKVPAAVLACWLLLRVSAIASASMLLMPLLLLKSLLLKSLLLKVPAVVLGCLLLLGVSAIASVPTLLLLRSLLLNVPAVVLTSFLGEDSESNLSRRMPNAHYFLYIFLQEVFIVFAIYTLY